MDGGGVSEQGAGKGDARRPSRAHLRQTRRVVNSADSGCWRLPHSAQHLPGKEAARMSQHAPGVLLDAVLDLRVCGRPGHRRDIRENARGMQENHLQLQ